MNNLTRRGPRRIVLEGIDGVGKTTLLRALASALSPKHRVLTETMAPVTLDLFKDFGRTSAGESHAYWTAVSRRTKSQVFLTEGVVRANCLANEYAQYDVVLLDRWWQTFHSYSEPADFDERCRFLRDALPVPDLIVHLRGDVDACAARLIADDDWLVRQTGEDGVVPFLRELQDRYDALFADDPAVLTVDVGSMRAADVLAVVLPAVLERLDPPTSLPATATPPPTLFRAPRSSQLVAVEGLDGSGKTTLIAGLTKATGGRLARARLAATTLSIFKKSVAASNAPPSTVIRDVFPDEFRHQTYLVDGLVSLACLAGREGTWLFDRWFPLTALYQDAIVSDRPFYDYLLSRFPVPGIILHLDLEPGEAVARLRERGDWMVSSLGEDGTVATLTTMRDRQIARLNHHDRHILDARLPREELVVRALKAVDR